MTKEKTDLSKLSTEEIYKLFDKGEINAKEFDELRNTLPKFKQDKLNSKLNSDKRREIIKLYKEGGLSISDTIAYENNLLLERNRKNTSTIVTIIAINIVLAIIGALIVASNF